MTSGRLAVSDVLDVAYPSAPEWSADGRFVASLVYEDDGNALLLTEPTSGGRGDADEGSFDSWRFAPDEGHVTSFAWGPDSRPATLVATTDAGDTLLVDADERTARRVFTGPSGESNHEWSNDGETVGYYRDGRVCLREVASGAERVLDVPERGSFLPTSRTLAWSEDDEVLAFAFADRETRQVGAVDVATGDLRWRTDDTASTFDPVWLGDGQLLVEKIDSGRTVRRFVAVDIDSGERSELFREDDDRGVVSAGAPAVSPDGTRLAAALPLDGWDHVHVFNAVTGERAQLTGGAFEDTGLAGASPRWLDDETLVFASNRRDSGQRQLFAVTLDGAVTPLVTSQGTNVSPAPSPNGDRIAYLHADDERSPELRVVSVMSDALDGLGDGRDERAAAGDPARLTESVVEAWPVSPVTPEEVTFDSADGTEIHGYLFDPRETAAVADDAAGLSSVVWVHGGPMRQMRAGWHPSRSYSLPYAFHQYLAERGYVGLFVNYRGGIGYGKAFRQALADGYGRDEMDDVVAAAEYLRERSYTSDSVGVWGLSYGGYATLQILGTHPEAFDVGVNLAGLADVENYESWAYESKFPAVESSQSAQLGGNPWEASEEWAAASPETHVENYESPLYNFHGTADAYVNFEQLDIVIDALLEHDKEYDADYYPGEGHVFSKRATWRRTFRKIARLFDDHL